MWFKRARAKKYDVAIDVEIVCLGAQGLWQMVVTAQDQEIDSMDSIYYVIKYDVSHQPIFL